ncbi:MAG: chromosome segregation protein SMC [Thermoplasmata archaeon HGW-Thermoplasmata-1]|nr:MAG: chromosome segregation protein SMC [Thermoplasmata archaeon HGW-Thermoplasmata-1]
MGCKLYLKEVRMENFKSFGHKLTVPFLPGFTAITGPNGSGKSNIGDAVLFVLGPRSPKAIRAGRLTDLIFNGGKSKKAATYCKVSLVFDNTDRVMPVDADEVSLMRFVKKAPRPDNPDNYYSYFYINGRAASLFEFVNLLNHARISADGYNIVKQGDVSQIIGMGSVERRRIVDTISGITDFDKDIEKAEGERAETESNLERIDIILDEVNKNIRQLKRDRDGALRYKELSEQLYRTKAALAHKKKAAVEAEIREVANQVSHYTSERGKLEEEVEKLKEARREAGIELQKLEDRMTELGGDEAHELRGKIDGIRTEETRISEKITFFKSEIGDLRGERQQAESDIKRVRKELSEIRQRMADLTMTSGELQKQTLKKDAELSSIKNTIASSDDSAMELSRELAKMKQDYEQKQAELHDLKLKRDRISERAANLEKAVAESEELKKTCEFELKDVEWEIGEISNTLKHSTKSRTALEGEIFRKKKMEAELTAQLNDLENAVRSLQRDYARLNAEKDAVESIQRGYNQAVEGLLLARDQGKIRGIYGTIAELGKVEEKFSVAMEVAAGGRMQSLVVEDDRVAAECINYLKDRNLGRATFLPLNKMVQGRPRGKSLMVVEDDASLGFAVDIVGYDPKYEAAFWYVYGDTIVLDTLTSARRLMGGVRMVTLGGELIEASGAMVGGSMKKSSVSFGGVDRSQIDTVSEKLRTALAHLDSVTAELTQLRGEMAEVQRQLGAVGQNVEPQTRISALEVKKTEYTNKLDSVKRELEEKREAFSAVGKELGSTHGGIDADEAALSKLNALLQERGQLLIKGAKKELVQKVRELEAEMGTLKDKLLGERGELDVLGKKAELVEARENELVCLLEDCNRRTAKHSDEIQRLEKTQADFKNQLETLIKVESQRSDKIRGVSDKRDQVYKKKVNLETSIDGKIAKMDSYVDLAIRAKQKLPTLEETLGEYMLEIKSYKIEVNLDEFPDTDAMKKDLRLIEESMRAIEPVNMRALEEYDVQVGRKKELDDQVKHLTEQRENLIKVVDEIVKRKTGRFYEVFNSINENFKDVYTKLTFGGEAELALDNAENPFEGGLTIKARPPGKKVLRLDALSGGEKSIASLAFVFSIQRYDPAPFYYFDEVDMNLDGVNAELVASMIKKYSGHAQFIMVSLRKISLKAADHVYGVTMQIGGLSEMIGNVDIRTVGDEGSFATRGGETRFVPDAGAGEGDMDEPEEPSPELLAGGEEA